MPYKNPEDQRASERRYYAAHREQALEKQRRHRAALKLHVNGIKASTPCTDCGVSYPYYVMDFDHVRGEKIGDLNRLVATGRKALVLAEMEKCELVCANCHRERTHQRALAQFG